MENLLRKVNSSPKISNCLKLCSYFSVIFSVCAYIWLLVQRYSVSRLDAVLLILASGIPFVTVSIFRKLFNAPRPYQIYDFYEKKPKSKLGSSFPSRHVFSIFLIGTLMLEASLPLSVILFLLGILLSVCRVLLGMHFIRDVLTGALVGILSGVIGILVL